MQKIICSITSNYLQVAKDDVGVAAGRYAADTGAARAAERHLQVRLLHVCRHDVVAARQKHPEVMIYVSHMQTENLVL